MKKHIKILIWLPLLFWTANAGGSPIGDRPGIWLDFQYRDTEQGSLFPDTFERKPGEFLYSELLEDMSLSEDQRSTALDLRSQENAFKVPVYSFVFSYGSYLHRWEIPQFQALVQTPFFGERPFEYRGPIPEPEPPPQIPLEKEEKYRYPFELMNPRHLYPEGLTRTFELEYALKLEKEADRFRYPFAPQDVPEPVQRMYTFGEVFPGEGGGGVGYGPAQSQYGSRYAAGGSGAYRGGPQALERIRKAAKEGSQEGGGGIDEFKTKGSPTKNRPYAVILVGAGLTALASLFRMFRLSLFLMVVWTVFFWKDLWLIIVELQ